MLSYPSEEYFEEKHTRTYNAKFPEWAKVEVNIKVERIFKKMYEACASLKFKEIWVWPLKALDTGLYPVLTKKKYDHPILEEMNSGANKLFTLTKKDFYKFDQIHSVYF
jgi:hypothetical protein